MNGRGWNDPMARAFATPSRAEVERQKRAARINALERERDEYKTALDVAHAVFAAESEQRAKEAADLATLRNAVRAMECATCNGTGDGPGGRGGHDCEDCWNGIDTAAARAALALVKGD